MILKLDSTSREQIKVEVRNKNIDKLVQKQKTGSQAILPQIVKILKKNRIKISELSGIEVNTGPGSFTGTRVGVAIANALGFALDIAVNSKKGKIAQPIYEKSKFD